MNPGVDGDRAGGQQLIAGYRNVIKQNKTRSSRRAEHLENTVIKRFFFKQSACYLGCKTDLILSKLKM